MTIKRDCWKKIESRLTKVIPVKSCEIGLVILEKKNNGWKLTISDILQIVIDTPHTTSLFGAAKYSLFRGNLISCIKPTIAVMYNCCLRRKISYFFFISSQYNFQFVCHMMTKTRYVLTLRDISSNYSLYRIELTGLITSCYFDLYYDWCIDLSY